MKLGLVCEITYRLPYERVYDSRMICRKEFELYVIHTSIELFIKFGTIALIPFLN